MTPNKEKKVSGQTRDWIKYKVHWIDFYSLEKAQK